MTKEESTIQSLLLHIESLEETIKALEQKSCEDAVSRESLRNAFKNTEDAEHCKWTLAGILYEIDNADSVTPTRKKGKWINGELIPNDITGHWYAECSECGKIRIIDNYCPNCGAEMEDEE